MCNGLYWVCTHSGNTDDENMNVFVIFFTDNNESCESLWNRVCVKSVRECFSFSSLTLKDYSKLQNLQKSHTIMVILQ